MPIKINPVLEQAERDCISIPLISTRLRWAADDPNIRRIMLSKNKIYNLSILVREYFDYLAEQIRRKTFDSTLCLFGGSLDVRVIGESSTTPNILIRPDYYLLYPSQR